MTDTKRQDFPAGLWVIATPIGNLSDLSPRARVALERADCVLCEDTRQTAKLFAALQIRVPDGGLHRFDAHSTARTVEAWVERLSLGGRIALVSDAGTPGVSDPGALLVAATTAAGIRVTPFPGPSAVMALLSASGFAETSFIFRGFFPREKGDQLRELELISKSSVAQVCCWFESPHRVLKAFRNIEKVCPEAMVAAAKELTKVHEKFFYGPISTVVRDTETELEAEGELGEWCFAVKFPSAPSEERDSSDWVKALQCLLDVPLPASDAARRVSQHFGAAKKLVYAKALELSEKKTTRGG